MKKVFVIEDDQFLEKLILRKLQSAGFDIFGTQNWTEAEKNIFEFMPDVLILDLMLPGEIDGFGILKELRSKSKFKDLKIIVFSNMADTETEKRTIDMGANAYMIKSNFTLDELVEKVNELV